MMLSVGELLTETQAAHLQYHVYEALYGFTDAAGALAKSHTSYLGYTSVGPQPPSLQPAVRTPACRSFLIGASSHLAICDDVAGTLTAKHA
jgi:hypothetical protein